MIIFLHMMDIQRKGSAKIKEELLKIDSEQQNSQFFLPILKRNRVLTHCTTEQKDSKQTNYSQRQKPWDAFSSSDHKKYKAKVRNQERTCALVSNISANSFLKPFFKAAIKPKYKCNKSFSKSKIESSVNIRVKIVRNNGIAEIKQGRQAPVDCLKMIMKQKFTDRN